MTEGKLLAPCLKLMRAELSGFVIVKHSDGFTSGVPDVSVTGAGKTTWWEFKEGPKVEWKNVLQQLTAQRLNKLGAGCHVVLYEEDTLRNRRTVILTPGELVVAAVPNFNHAFVVDFIRNYHAA